MICRLMLVAGFLMPTLSVMAADGAAEEKVEGMSIEPGKWRITTTTTLSDMPQPMTSGNAFCYADGILRPENLHSEDMRADCEYKDKDIGDTYMSWKVECSTDAGGSKSSWTASSFTDRFKSSGFFIISYGEDTSSMTIEMVGKHLGDCNKTSTQTAQQ